MPTIPAADRRRLEREIGAPGQAAYGGIVDAWEETPELRWPDSVAVYDRMRRTDGQVGAVERAVKLPLMGANWRLEGDKVDKQVIEMVRRELGLPDPDGKVRPYRQGISWREFLRHALLSLSYGHMAFEQVYTVAELDEDLPAGPLEGRVAHLHKLAPRLPRSITAIDVARDGGLLGIRQYVPNRVERIGPQQLPTVLEWVEVAIPVESLVYFCHEREGADWAGQSIHRQSYKSWLIKERLERLGPMTVERNGMGVPVVYYPAGGDRRLALDLAASFRAGEEAGAAVPDDYRIELLGVSGSTKDELPLVKHHDESIGRASLAMVLNLGHDNGARSLGDTFVDLFMLAEKSIAQELAETITEHVVRDLVRINLGDDAPYPALVCEDLAERPELTADALKVLVDGKVIRTDDVLEKWAREKWNLPKADPGSRPEVPPLLAPFAGQDGPPPPDTAGPGEPGKPVPPAPPATPPAKPVPPGPKAVPRVAASAPSLEDALARAERVIESLRAAQA